VVAITGLVSFMTSDTIQMHSQKAGKQNELYKIICQAIQLSKLGHSDSRVTAKQTRRWQAQRPRKKTFRA